MDVAELDRIAAGLADLESGDGGALEDALMAAWALQAGHG
jgi:hypothetical protein